MVRPDVAELIAAVAAMPSYETMTPDAARAASAARRAPVLDPPLVAAIDDRRIGDEPDAVPVRVYRADPAADAPVVVFLHGGGWVLCDLDSHDLLCRHLVRTSGCTVVSVDYRRAPEHRFPAAVDDAERVVRWVAAHRGDLGGAGRPIGIVGDSAGANLAAAVAVTLRHHPDVGLGAQALLYPVTDADFDTPSYQEFGTGYPLTRDAMRWYWDQYVPDPADRLDPRAAPLRAPDVTGAAPALVITAGLDPLRDEGEAYAGLLARAGVPVERHRFDDVFHGFASIAALPESHAALAMVGSHLRRHLGATRS